VTVKTRQLQKRVSPKEASDILYRSGYMLSARTVIRMCQSGQISGARKIGARWFLPQEAVDRLIG
jgi:hypothetical protein